MVFVTRPALRWLLLCTVFYHGISAQQQLSASKPDYEWAVVGAGPAGILTVGLLLDNQVAPEEIVWIDTDFAVGVLGKQYQNVPGNLSVTQWIGILDGCESFKECPTDPVGQLKQHDPKAFYPLSIIAEPLQQITNWFLSRVNGVQGKVTAVQAQHDLWRLSLGNATVVARKVVLATGSRPRSLDYPCAHTIDLMTALDKDKLAQVISPDDTIAVVGSAHSAVIILMWLCQLPVKQVVQLYNKPFLYTDPFDYATTISVSGVVNAETGLKGVAARFAREVLETNCPAHILRMLNTQEARDTWLPQCTKIVYAIGFEPVALPKGLAFTYDDTTGVIAPNLFGIGIAFPERKADAAGKMEYRVGMPHFLSYGKRVVPQWIAA